jgi:hypothetical protein
MVHSTPTKIYMSEHEEPKPHVDRTLNFCKMNWTLHDNYQVW